MLFLQGEAAPVDAIPKASSQTVLQDVDNPAMTNRHLTPVIARLRQPPSYGMKRTAAYIVSSGDHVGFNGEYPIWWVAVAVVSSSEKRYFMWKLVLGVVSSLSMNGS